MMTQIDISTIKGFFAGSGMDAFGEITVVERLLSITGCFDSIKKTLISPIYVAYIGTATYDLPKHRHQQTKWFDAYGCTIVDICVADPSQPNSNDDNNNNNNNNNNNSEELHFLENAHIILVSGGNTLYAIRRWEETGLDLSLRAAAARGSIIAGGSAGAICWFTSGHSDSANPATYVQPMLQEAMNEAKQAAKDKGEVVDNDNNNNNNNEKKEKEEFGSWNYIRVHGLNILPGLLCPHHDKRESNGILREEDFNKMLKRHPTERGIGIDHWAVLILPGDGTYEVFKVPGKFKLNVGSGSAETTPGVYIKDVVDGKLQVSVIPEKGNVQQLLRKPTGPLVKDPFEMYYTMENPTANTEKMLSRSR